MKKNFLNLTFLLTLFSTGLVAQGLIAQAIKPIQTNAGQMKLSGTSTMHDWAMNGVFQIQGNFKMEEGTNKLQAVNDLSFHLPVENLKSDKKKLDETAYKALKTETYKDISYQMTWADIKEVKPNTYEITTLGNLTIAGVTKPIKMNVNWVQHADKTVTCTGIQKLKMTDFQVKPPSFLGVMKTGDEISLDFSFLIKS